MAVVHEGHIPVTSAEVPWAVRHGIIGGIVAGLVFAAFEMLAAAAMMGGEAFFMPLRMIGAIVLGAGALEAAYPLLGAALAGVAVHMALAVVYGVVFAVAFGGLRSLWADVGIGAAYGFVLWLLNFYVIAPLAFPWFLEADVMTQFLAHTFFFGAALGCYLWWVRERQVAKG